MNCFMLALTNLERNKRFYRFVMLAVIIVFSPLLSANIDSTGVVKHQIILIDGTTFSGVLEYEDEAVVQLLTDMDVTMIIPKDKIKSRESFHNEGNRQRVYLGDPNNTRLLFSPTGRPLKAGQGYFSAYEVFFPMLAVGVTDFLSIAGGVSLVPGVDGQAVYFAPKITPIHTEKFSLAGGVLHVMLPENTEDIGIAYGVSTYGTDMAAISVGAGWMYNRDDTDDRPIVMFGGEVRLGANTKFITENWLIPNSDVDFISFGFRVFGEKLAADFAMVHPAGGELNGFPFVPWVGFAYNFATKE